MNTGKISESIYKRSVYKTIHTTGYQGNDTMDGAGLGADCAILAFDDAKLVTAQAMANGKDVLVGARALHHAVNHLAAFGYTEAKVTVSVLVPEELREIKLRNMLEKLVEQAKAVGAEIANTEVHVLPGLAKMVVNCTASELLAGSQDSCETKAKPGQDLIMTKWIGLEGTVALVGEKLTQLQTRYPLQLLEQAADFERFLSVIPEAATAIKSGATAMHVVREGGVFGALWEFAQRSGVGLVVDLKRIPVKQETIEVCEFFDINPYELLSGGSLLIAADNGMDIVAALQQQGIAAAIIGKTNDGNDRVVINGEEKRFLEPAKHDEFYSEKIK
ncbi:MAG: hydrogenase maturation factor [Lachnospiraceae bacterium]|nr:hydrogenase maturation factor [Lachnospiraceae bacterium]